MFSRNALVSILGVVALFLASGCTSTATQHANEATLISQRVISWDALKKKVPDATYVVNQPDAISIEFMSPLPPPTPPVVATLRQDGIVTLPYLEDVKVDGMTTIQIREKLENLYSKYYKEPKLLVKVVGFNSKHIYVYGEAGRNGSIPYHGHETFSDVMGEVGGVNTRAAYWRCKVIRGDPDHPEFTMVNFRKIMLEGDLREDVSIAENDVIRVPPTAIAWFGDRIAELLSPFSSALNLAGTVGSVRAAPTNFTGNPANASGTGYSGNGQ